MCVKAGALGQNTYPYYALDSINLDGNYDSGDLKADMWTDDEESYQVMMLSDNSVVFFDVPDSVSSDGIAFVLTFSICFWCRSRTKSAHLWICAWEGSLSSPSSRILGKLASRRLFGTSAGWRLRLKTSLKVSDGFPVPSRY